MTLASQQQSISAENNHSNIRIATINLFNFIEPPLAFYDFENIYSHGQWQKKCQWFGELLNQYHPDIVGFQEVFSPDRKSVV